MINVKITSKMIKNAEKMSKRQGILRRSFMNGQGNLYGYLGEEIFTHLFPEAERVNGYNCDFLWNGKKIDIKSKHCNTPPKPFYECSIADYLKKAQTCDYYVFMRIKKDLTEGWLLGIIKKEDYFAKAKFLKKGDIDPSNNYTVRHSCYNLKIEDLDAIN